MIYLFVLVALMLGACQKEEAVVPEPEPVVVETPEPEPEPEREPELPLLINDEHPLPMDYDVALVVLDNGERVGEEIFPSLQALFGAAREAGYAPMVVSGYRSYEEQEALFSERVQEHLASGYSYEEALELTRDYVADPGASEHGSGLAVDINPEWEDGGALYAWLAERAHEWGFILRYPLGKEILTGTEYEPWHFRYVGVEQATRLYESGEVLEELYAS